jgi:pimeloyl-ACP methyl ester carboxylesterase
LVEHHDVIAMDLPGFGGSPVPPGGMPIGMRATVTALALALEEMGLSRPHVAGNSLGGAIALELAAAGVVASATAFSPGRLLYRGRGAPGRPDPRHDAGHHVPADRSAAGLAAFAHGEGPLVRPARRLPGPAEPRTGGRRRARPAPRVRLPTVVRSARGYSFDGSPDVPVTVAWGSKDHILQPHQAERARERLPKARHVDLPGCGHVPMSDAPDLVARLVLETTGAVAIT